MLTDSDGTTHPTLSLLHLQICQEDTQHILRTNSLGDITERVDSRSSNRSLMGLEQVKKLETDSHPFLSRDIFGTSIGNTTNQVDGRFLNLFVSVSKNGGHSGDCQNVLTIGSFVTSTMSLTKILDGRVHLCHTNNVRDSPLRGDKTSKESAYAHFMFGK